MKKQIIRLVIVLTAIAVVVMMALSFIEAQERITLSVCVDHQFKLSETKKTLAMQYDLKDGDEVPQKLLDEWLDKFYTDGTWESFQCRALEKGQYFHVGRMGEVTRCPVHGTHDEVRALFMRR